MSNKGIKAGKPCTKNSLKWTENHPYIPATTTQVRKKRAIFWDHWTSDIVNDHSNPTAKKPLYKPWLAAKILVFSNKSLSNMVNVLLPSVVHANISI